MRKSFFLFLSAIALLQSCKQHEVQEHSSAPKPDTIVAQALPISRVADPAIPASGKTADDFLPDGYFVQHIASGDINNDGQEDVVVVMRERKDSTSSRALVVLLGNASANGFVLAGVGWNAISGQYTADGYPVRYSEDLTIDSGRISLKLYDQGPGGNLFTTYRYLNGEVQLTDVETFYQGAGGASRMTMNLLSGIVENEEINRTKDPEESTYTTDTMTPEKILLRESNPDEMINGKSHL